MSNHTARGHATSGHATRDRVIIRAHGGGGSAMQALLEEHIFSRFQDPRLQAKGDAATWAEIIRPGDRLAMTTDAYVVKPLFFPGGDLGRLAVAGTVNDLAVSGARPVALSLALILEEGFPVDDLGRLLDSAAATAREAGVPIVTGDTKVVERGAGGGCYATTAGIGVVPVSVTLGPELIEPGDAVILSGPIADHGVAVMAARLAIDLGEAVRSDVAPLNGLIETLLAASNGVRFMRDATRGGVASVLTELATATARTIEIEEAALPVRAATRAALSILGLDPLTVANEGVIVLVVRGCDAEQILAALSGHQYGRAARRIGTIGEAERARVILETTIGGRRIILPPYGEELPRIC